MVDQIAGSDFGVIEARPLAVESQKLRPFDSLCFTVSFDPGSKLYEATGPFDVAVAAETRAEQEAQLDAELAMLWQEYALAEPATLISAAQQLRQKFLAMFGDIFEKRKRKWNRR